MAELSDDQLREFLCTRVRPAVLEHYSPNSCLATTKVALEVLRAAGIPARPWPCSLLVANSAAAPLYLQVMTDGEIAEAVAAGAHAVEVMGHGTTDKGWDGHMVAIAQFSDAPHLLDLSLDQARRSTWSINVGPAAIPLWADTDTAELPIWGWVGDAMVRWAPLKDTSWRSAPDWRLNDLTAPIAGVLIRELRELVR